MEYRYVNNIKEEFAKLRIFDVISDVKLFQNEAHQNDVIVFDLTVNQSTDWEKIMKETLLSFHFKLKHFKISKTFQKIPKFLEIYGNYEWKNVYPPYQELEVILASTSITFKFQKEYSAYEFLNWIDDICRNANKVRGDPPAKFEELRNIHQLLQEEKNEHIMIEDHHDFLFPRQEKKSGRVADKPQTDTAFLKWEFHENTNLDLNCKATLVTKLENCSFYKNLLNLCQSIDPHHL